MKKTNLIISLSVATLILVGLAFVCGTYFGRRISVATNVVTPEPPIVQRMIPVIRSSSQGKTKLYTSDRFHFSIEYPTYMDDIQEEASRVTYGLKDNGGRPSYVVTMEKVPFNSTKDWLAAQPKGSASSAGYEVWLWLSSDLTQNDTALVSEYRVVDRDGNNQIYGKYLYAVRVERGTLYKLFLDIGQRRADDVPEITQEDIAIVTSFRVTP